ncbi:glycosyltransferase family 4 protein [Microbacterium sp. B2969]|uniref:Glycosyltransferase family 4 protein n=1 Tax=Microbacterium alkaliflavum TaxID=3248839 RepID=A0ABW7QBA8_9MICO
MTRIRVDDRYRGAHGIGRYASEVLPRLALTWQPLGLGGSPYTPLDAFRPLPALGRDELVYSPGYGALTRARRQILTIHDLIQLQLPWPGRAKFSAYYAGPVRHAVRKAGVVLTVSETSARAIREWLRDDAVEVVNAGNGCSDAFRPDGAAETSVDPHLLFVGNMRRHKNLDVVLRALVAAPAVRLAAVIPEPEAPAVRSRAAALGVGARVTVLHGIDDDRLAALYRGAAATVMPSTLEGFGLPALESISCGVPVVYWRGCEAVAEIVGDRGWAVDGAHDVDEWATALETAVSTGRRVEPPPVGVYDWHSVGAAVSDVLDAG